jgi:hypothetical protein
MKKVPVLQNTEATVRPGEVSSGQPFTAVCYDFNLLVTESH